jgi:hypothetical protein
VFTPCNEDGLPGSSVTCGGACLSGKGCTECVPDLNTCVGNEIHACGPEGHPGDLIQACDVGAGETCAAGACKNGCDAAKDQPSNVGCEFWAVDLDQQDGAGNDPASAPWGVVLSNAGQIQANVTIELNTAPPGQPPQTMVVSQKSVPAGQLVPVALPTRELDCGTKPNDYASPGTCLSSNAYRITSSAPIVVYQFNVFTNAFSNDASLLLPTNALGKLYRVIGWSGGHPAPVPPLFPMSDRSYVTVVGTEANTKVRVHPSWRIKGNAPIAATAKGGTIEVVLGPFDVLNLETDDATLQEAAQAGVSDLTGTTVVASAPVAVFSGVESTAAPYHVDIPTYPGWDDSGSGNSCCLDHLEEQLFPLESIGKKYVITRSPVRSTGSYKEPDVLRFVGAAAVADVSTTLPAPFDHFTLQPGEVKDTWADRDIIVTSDQPLLVGQILISQGYVEGATLGDPSLTVFPPVEQYRTEYVILTPPSWTKNYVVISAPEGTEVTIDGQPSASCLVEAAGALEGTNYEARRCPVGDGAHVLSGSAPFGIVAYGYGSAGSYAFAGGADVKRIYEPPNIE